MSPRALLGKTRFKFRCRVALRTEAVLKTRILRVFFWQEACSLLKP